MAYLRSNPRAADTVEGIAQWWLRRGATTPARTSVQAALELLVARGSVVCHVKTDGAAIYRAAARPD